MSRAGTVLSRQTLIAIPRAGEALMDHNRMLTVFINLLGIPRGRELMNHPIRLALCKEGFYGFNNDFVHLTDSAIECLTYELPLGDGTPRYIIHDLSSRDKLKIRAILAFYHSISKINGGAVNMCLQTQRTFRTFQATVYDPTKPIIPWSSSTSRSQGVNDWNKLVKPSGKDFKTFREGLNWYMYKEDFLIALRSMNLSHLIDENFVVIDTDLDEAQRHFLYKIMKDNFLHHEAKKIAREHKDDQDTREIWKKVCKYYDDSINTSMSADAIMAYLSGVKYHTANWNRPQAEFITHWHTMFHKYNEIAPDAVMNDAQGVRNLQNVFHGTPNLAHVLQQWRQARSAAGADTTITLDHYVSLLGVQADIYDAANSKTRNTYRRTAKAHELEDVDEGEYEVNKHDMDDDYPSLDEILEANVNNSRNQNPRNKTTGRFVPKNNRTQKHQANQMQGKRACVSGETWNSLNAEDKALWDKLSDNTKSTVTAYHFNKGKEYASRSNSEVSKVEAQEHDTMIFDDDDDGIEARVHDSDKEMKEESKEPQDKSIEATKALYDEEGVDFDKIIQAQKANTRFQVTMHDLDGESGSEDEGVPHLEVNMHWYDKAKKDEEEEEKSNRRPARRTLQQELLESSDEEEEDETGIEIFDDLIQEDNERREREEEDARQALAQALQSRSNSKVQAIQQQTGNAQNRPRAKPANPPPRPPTGNGSAQNTSNVAQTTPTKTPVATQSSPNVTGTTVTLQASNVLVPAGSSSSPSPTNVSVATQPASNTTSTAIVVRPTSTGSEMVQSHSTAVTTDGTNEPTEQTQVSVASNVQPDVQATPLNDSSENKSLTRSRGVKKNKQLPEAHKAPYPPTRKVNPKKKASSAPNTPARGSDPDSSTLVPSQPEQNSASPVQSDVSTLEDDATNQEGTVLSEQEFQEQARTLTTSIPTLTTLREPITRNTELSQEPESLEGLTGVDSLGAIMRNAVRANNGTRDRLDPDWRQRLHHERGNPWWFSPNYHEDQLIYKHFIVNGKKMLVKSDDGFDQNLWVAEDGYFNDEKRLYFEVSENEKTASEMVTKSQSFDSNESGTQTPDSTEAKEMATGVQSFTDLLEQEGQLVDGSSTASRKKKGKKKKPQRTMKEELMARKLPSKGKTSSSPNMKSPFQEVKKPIPTLIRIVPIGDDRWDLVPEEEHLRQREEEELAAQYEREQVDLICSPTNEEEDEPEEISDFASDVYQALGDAGLEYDEYGNSGEEDDQFQFPNPRRTARSTSPRIREYLPTTEVYHSAQSSPNQNRFEALQDQQEEVEEDATQVNVPDIHYTGEEVVQIPIGRVIPPLPDSEQDPDLVTSLDENGGNEAVVNAEGSTEIQGEQLEDEQLDQGSDVDKQDFHGASSE